MTRLRITGATQDILEDEDLCDAVNAVGAVLRGNGASKYPRANWLRVSHAEHAHKSVGHMSRAGELDPESGLPHEAHAAARALMALALALRGRRG